MHQMTSFFTLAVFSLAESTTSGAGKSNSSTANKRSFQRTQTIRHSRTGKDAHFAQMFLVVIVVVCKRTSILNSGACQRKSILHHQLLSAQKSACHLLLFESDSALSMSKWMSVWTLEGQARSPLAARIRSICTTSPATLRLILLSLLKQENAQIAQ